MLPTARRAVPSVCACALALALVPQPAHAQSAAERDRQARAEFLAGREAFTRGNYEDAARRFERAHQLSRRPQLLYNLGTSYDRLHRWNEARDAFVRYLAEAPEAAERDEVRARLAVIEREIERERQLTEQAQRQQVVVVREERERIVVRPVPAPAATSPWRVTGFVTGGLAVLAGATSLTVGVLTNAHYDRLVAQCGSTSEGCSQAVIDDVALRASIVNVFFGTALVLAAGSVASFSIDLLRPRETPEAPGSNVRASVMPLAAPNGALTGGMVVLTGAL
jgi:tetratricopeptide (TPR) repeat protein